jgi:hypothetical protein
MPKDNIMGDADTGIISLVHKRVSTTKRSIWLLEIQVAGMLRLGW